MSLPTESARHPGAMIGVPPRGLALLAAIGPAIIWCAEYIGSGEVLLATRTGAVLGTGVLWAVVAGVFLKYLIGLAGGWYTAATGESMIDLFGRLPGPRNAFVWLVLVAQLVASVLAIGSIATVAGVFVAELAPVSPFLAGWGVTLTAVAVAWWGEFRLLKTVMAILVTLTLAGVMVIALKTFPPLEQLVAGLWPQVPVVPDWAQKQGLSPNAWAEVLPLLGWGAGGFASQVWYSYWVLGAGYGAAAGRTPGAPADLERLHSFTGEDAQRLLGWRRLVTVDATAAMLVGVAATAGFLFAGAGVLGERQLAPEGADVALTLATLFQSQWGAAGATLFLVGGAAALVSTQFAQVVGWPMLLDDCVRLCLPRLAESWSPVARRRVWLGFYLVTSMTIVYTFGFRPVALVRLAAVLEGLVLTPLQALALLVGLYYVMPRMHSGEVARALRPGWLLGIGLVTSFLVFSYFCVAQLPAVLAGR